MWLVHPPDPSYLKVRPAGQRHLEHTNEKQMQPRRPGVSTSCMSGSDFPLACYELGCFRSEGLFNISAGGFVVVTADLLAKTALRLMVI